MKSFKKSDKVTVTHDFEGLGSEETFNTTIAAIAKDGNHKAAIVEYHNEDEEFAIDDEMKKKLRLDKNKTYIMVNIDNLK